MVDLQLSPVAVIEQLVRADATSLPNSTNRNKRLAVVEFDDVTELADGGGQRLFIDQVASSAGERKDELGLAGDSAGSIGVDLLQKFGIVSSPSFDGSAAFATDGMSKGIRA